jgi:hypothetical protein
MRSPGEQPREDEMGQERPMSPAEQPVAGDPAVEREPMPREPMPERMPETMPAGTEPADVDPGRLPGIEVDAYRRRFEMVQAEFIDEPRRAVEKAKSLVEEAIDRLMKDVNVKHDPGSGDDTERLRVTLKRYRDVLYMLGDGMR